MWISFHQLTQHELIAKSIESKSLSLVFVFVMISQDRRTFRAAWVIGCVFCTIVTASIAIFELQRVEHGRLFAVALPGEEPPTAIEVEDARESAAENRYRAVFAILAIGIGVTAVGNKSHEAALCRLQFSRAVLLFFAFAVVADLLTTIHFFHAKGIVFELHPGIRLFGYAYGRTVGPILGKSVQAFGVIAVASLLGHRGYWLLIAVGTVYTIAAIYNESAVF